MKKWKPSQNKNDNADASLNNALPSLIYPTTAVIPSYKNLIFIGANL